MRILSRDFSIKEKIFILFLVLVLVVLLYYQFIDRPIAESLEIAAGRKESLELELEAITVRVTQLERMKNEVDDVESTGDMKPMPSYNNGKNVNTLLNNVLGEMGYSIAFSNLTRSGNQVRRNITIQFAAPNYEAVKTALSQLTNSEYRCMIGNLQCAFTGVTLPENAVNVSVAVTFYETVVGGTADSALPVE